ncbi:uncharacterized protein LOC134943895 [Pseudophryne corroboree]|uniref:uncharacterized protein LOC134943895 n=1 Tax=Pseudophryne corroboree TaxID=495146 RepID=UPI003081CCF4
MAIKKHRVGVFSRDGEDNYLWLISLLRRPMFRSVVEDVFSVYISDKSPAFQRALTKCTFAILYHTERRGRLNITNVTDSLYDQQLEDLSTHLGRENVVVLLDDLNDGSDNTRRRILQDQPLVDTCACELVLISEVDKKSSDSNGRDVRWSQASGSQQLQDQDNSLHKKMRKVMDIMSRSLKNTADVRYSDETASDYTDEGQGRGRYSMKSTSVYSSDPDPQLLPASDWDSIPDAKKSTEGQKGPKKTGKKLFEGSKISDANVFWITGGLIVILTIVFIVILCLTV